MVIRLATKNDIEIIVKLRLKMLQDYEENLPQELSGAIQNYLEKHINDNSCICSLAEIDRTIVSMAMLCGYEEIPDEINLYGKVAKLCAVYTMPEYRGKGYMEKLLTYLIKEGKKSGIKTILNSADMKAIPLYERVGFHTSSTIMYIDL